MEAERAKGRECLTRSVKLAQLVRYCSPRRSRDNRLVGRTVARVPVKEHMANYQAARAPMGKGRNAGEGAAGLSKGRTSCSACTQASN